MPSVELALAVPSAQIEPALLQMKPAPTDKWMEMTRTLALVDVDGKISMLDLVDHFRSKKFIRISLGGLKDEADIRGHKRTYIGRMPGCLIDGLKKVAVCNPVMLLDEIDKMGSDVRRDPASALLEVLDPEQNKTFSDQYRNVRVIYCRLYSRAKRV
ncbi:lon protease homolog 2, peroxisomal-like protein isoform X2 [Tanacetum coccineum]